MLPPLVKKKKKKKKETGEKKEKHNRKEKKHVKGLLSWVTLVLSPIKQPGDSTARALVSSFLAAGTKTEWKHGRRLCSPFQTSTLLKGYGWFAFYLSTGVARLAGKLASGQMGWQLPGWCYRLTGPGGPAGAKPHNHCNYLWRGEEKGSAYTCDRHALINRCDLHPVLAFAVCLTAPSTPTLLGFKILTFWSPQCLICKFDAAVAFKHEVYLQLFWSKKRFSLLEEEEK